MKIQMTIARGINIWLNEKPASQFHYGDHPTEPQAITCTKLHVDNTTITQIKIEGPTVPEDQWDKDTYYTLSGTPQKPTAVTLTTNKGTHTLPITKIVCGDPYDKINTTPKVNIAGKETEIDEITLYIEAEK